MIGFVTWSPFSYYKGGQVTKPIILVKICYKLLKYAYTIQLDSGSLLGMRRFGKSHELSSEEIFACDA